MKSITYANYILRLFVHSKKRFIWDLIYYLFFFLKVKVIASLSPSAVNSNVEAQAREQKEHKTNLRL